MRGGIISEAEQFFTALYGSSVGLAEIVTEAFTVERWFEYPRELATMVKYVDLRSEEDVYCSTTLFGEKRRLTETATEGRVVYADADTCAPENFRLTPSITVQTSPGKWHTHWMLDQAHTAAEVSEISHKIATAHKAQGCDAGWIPTKLLRVPGTMNTKYPVPYRVEATYSGDLYTLDEVQAAYADVSVEKVKEADDSLAAALPSLLEATGKIPEEAWNLYADEPPKGADWSSRLWKLELSLFRAGLTREEVFVIARAAKCNKYERDGRDDSLLWKEVNRASMMFTEEEPVNHEPVKTVEVAADFSFLDDRERQWVLKNPTFIEEFSDWIGERSPMSAVTYRRSLAYMLLSCVYGDKAYVRPKYGKTYLNLWVYTLGETTATKKTTVIKMMKEVLREWEAEAGHDIYIGDDFTSEGLTKALADRGTKVSLLMRDEVDGLFRELLVKNYMSGVAETLTALYDGEVRRSLRATQGAGQNIKTDTVFNFVGTGTDKAVSEVLTVKQFHSGFMIRPLWAIADAPPWRAENEHLIMADDDVYVKDPKPEEFVDKFKRMVMKMDLPADGSARQIGISKEALHRLHRWQDESHALIDGVKNQEYIDPSRQRMAVSMLKAAALLAVHGGSHKIEIQHVLPVIYQSEFWFKDMVRMVNSVASSEFEGKVNAVESFISSKEDQRAVKSKVYHHFASFTVGQVDEFIRSLQEQGRIKVTRQDDKQYLQINE